MFVLVKTTEDKNTPIQVTTLLETNTQFKMAATACQSFKKAPNGHNLVNITSTELKFEVVVADRHPEHTLNETSQDPTRDQALSYNQGLTKMAPLQPCFIIWW